MANPISADDFSINVAALSISVINPAGDSVALSIKSLSGASALGPNVENRDCPILYPQYKYQTGYSEDRQSCGTGSNAFWEVTWTAHYYYAHAQIGTGRYGNEHNGKISDNCQAIADAIATSFDVLGVVDVEVDMGDPDIVPGPDDTQFYGATIDLRVKAWRNAA